MIEDTDLYSQKFNENLLQSIYNFFDVWALSLRIFSSIPRLWSQRKS